MSEELKKKGGKKKKKGAIEPELIKDKAYYLSKCEQFSKLAEDAVADKITSGEITIRETPLHIEYEKKDEESADGDERDIRQKINSLNEDLESLQHQMLKQRQEERKRQEAKKKEAKILIQRLRKQKQQHRNRIKFNQINHRLKDSVFSEDVLRMMKEHREKLVMEKKKDMQLKIYQNLHRKVVREEENSKKQITYWMKVQEIQSKKRYHSTKVLPRIQNRSEDRRNQPELGVNLQNKNLIIPRKNSHMLHKKSKSKQDILQYPQIIQKFIQRAKAKQQSKSDRSPRDLGRSRTISNDPVSQRQEHYQNMSRISQNQKIDNIVVSQVENKRKLLGDQYLKESLLRVKSPKNNQTKADESMAQESLELKANAAIFSRNDKLVNLEERREKVLNNLLTGKIDKGLAIEMLHPLDNKLDRINPSGIEKRLKNKLQIFEEHRKKFNKIQISANQNDAWEESSQHGI